MLELELGTLKHIGTRARNIETCWNQRQEPLKHDIGTLEHVGILEHDIGTLEHAIGTCHQNSKYNQLQQLYKRQPSTQHKISLQHSTILAKFTNKWLADNVYSPCWNYKKFIVSWSTGSTGSLKSTGSTWSIGSTGSLGSTTMFPWSTGSLGSTRS